MSNYYRIWFLDGSRVLFRGDQISTHAERFGFDPSALLSDGEVDLIDEDGQVVGGVMFEGEAR